MAEIAIIKDDYSFNFDDSWLYKGEEMIVEITGREADLLRCFCEAPNQKLSFDRISRMVEEMDFRRERGTRVNSEDIVYFGPNTIKPWKSNLLKKHGIFRDKTVINTVKGQGYIYYGGGIKEVTDSEKADILNRLPHELTDNTFINASKESILFRENEYRDVLSILEESKSIILTGMGGRGKTSIARLVYSGLKDSYGCCGWVNYNGDIKQSLISALLLDDYSDETMTENDIQKKWKYIAKKFANNKQSKLLVIDNVDYIEGIQSPNSDQELKTISGWDNLKIIITSRLPGIDGFDNVYKVNNLGEKDNCEKCVELFYHYNPDARDYMEDNYKTVEKLCERAGYNTMVIELLAKSSRYDYDSLERFYDDMITNGFSYIDEVPVDTLHDNSVISVMNDDGTVAPRYYGRGKETAASQLMKLFDMQTRSSVEKQILWDFHCLPEAERVSREELKNWMGYSIKDIDRLKDQSWIKYENGSFYMHPLVSQAVSCKEPEWERYWEKGEDRRKNEKSPSLITKLKECTLFDEEDRFAEGIRKIYFSDYLSYEGRFLEPTELLYLADYARKRGIRDISRKYYKLSYDKLSGAAETIGILDPVNKIENLDSEKLDQLRLFWKSVYFYGYILSYTRSGYDDAESCLSIACKVIQEIDRFLPMEEAYRLTGMSFDHYGYVKSNNHKNKLDNFVNACMLYRLAIEYRKKLIEKFPDNMSYYKDLAWSLDNLGTLFAITDYDRLEGSMGTDADLCLSGSSELFSYEKEYQFFMNSEGKAEEYLRSALEMRIKVGELKGDGNLTEVAWTYCNLASLLSKTEDRYEEAEQCFIEALIIYEDLDKRFPSQHASSQARTYTAYGKLLTKWSGRIEDALSTLEKALEINEMLEHDYPGVYIKEIENVRNELDAINYKK